jgi:hypothetical protein
MITTQPYAIHLFAPAQPDRGRNWVEQILGEVVKPIVDAFRSDIQWVWVTRYSGRYDTSALPLGAHLSPDFIFNGYYRFVVIRIMAHAAVVANIQAQVIEKATRAGCYIHPDGWITYDFVKDLGSDRFIRPDAASVERERRADLVARFVYATLQLMLDSLVTDQHGSWMIENNADEAQNPRGSYFQSVHHLYCNVTNVPTDALVVRRNGQIRHVMTYLQYSYITGDIDDQQDQIDVYPIRF